MSRWWRTVEGGLRTAEGQRLYHTIQAIPRELSGRRMSIRDRTQGRTPAVVFAHNYVQANPNDPTTTTVKSISRKLLLTTETRQIQYIFKSVELPFICSTTFPIEIRAGSGSSHLLESGRVLPIKVHRDSETGKIFNLVFIWADEGMNLKVDVPVVFKGEDVCPGIKKGGYLNKVRTSLKYFCPAEHIPSKFEVDVSNLDIGDRVFIRDIEVHPSLKLLSKKERMPVCKIMTTDLENKITTTDLENKITGTDLENFESAK